MRMHAVWQGLSTRRHCPSPDRALCVADQPVTGTVNVTPRILTRVNARLLPEV